MGDQLGRRLARTGVAAAFSLTCVFTPASAQAADVLDYVALGDSAAAGPLIPGPDPNLACLRSGSNYPGVAAGLLGARLTDVTCSGAELNDLTGRQHGFVPPQFDALGPQTDLVSVTIGGNDADLVQAAISCINLLPEPIGRSCADGFTSGGRDELGARIDAVAPRFGEALDAIRDRAPNAEVVVVGYGTYIRPGGCYPVQPIWARDADYIQNSVDRLSAMLRAEAAEHGAKFVDIGPLSRGHDTCAAPSEKYFEGVIPTSIAAPLHPNANGMRAFGQALSEAVRSEAPTVS
ncbi:GDSL-like lipase/acylhydrolase family protein [Saccharopolyspora erythraea NRRL 2338]|uniref:SGNH/GDSL hydrolase family protein n=1 Tax=Saccharopolyspora erythraea TaxID=1836 RepID=A0ABP3N385_SACER|nr:SGNH/GDSL hydrolase family protein [Saccharopolyspora erythraea]EQD85739.1 hydrolase [Saccharopolyspora erythraea D]PFG93042.1 GDSL-like lipase/acylhydrolase family protein [Saccharopolyspora erythraea NRRL 2338]